MEVRLELLLILTGANYQIIDSTARFVARLDVVCAVLHEYCVLRWRNRGFDISVSRFCDDEV